MTEENTIKLIKKLAPKVAKEFNVNKNLLANLTFGIIAVESNHKYNAINNHSTARGLMQVLINTQREVEKKHLKVPFAPAMYESRYFPDAPVTNKSNDKLLIDPYYSVLVGMSYLAYQLNRYKDTYKAVFSYNQGSYNQSPDGKKYTEKVFMKIKNIYKPIFY